MAKAIKPSDSIIRTFRLYRSASTPPNSETNTCGSTVQMVASISQVPDEVVRVMCQMIENPTTEEPNRETFWLNKNRAALFFQPVLADG